MNTEQQTVSTIDILPYNKLRKKHLMYPVSFQFITKACLFKYTENFTTQKWKIFR